MSNRITTLFDLDDRGFTQSLKRLRTDMSEADGFVNKMKAGASGLGDTLKANMGPAALAAGTALVGFGIKAVGAFTDTAKAAIDMGAATGLAVEDASRWIAVGDDMGVSASELTAAFGKVVKTLDGKVWEKYGIATRDAGGHVRATNDIILDAFDVLSKTTSETERARIGTEMFGKGYANLAPLVGKSRKEMESYLGSVEKGQVITAKEAKRAEDFRLAMDTLRDSLHEITQAFGQAVAGQAPLLKGLAKLVELAAQIPSWLRQGSSAVVELDGHLQDFKDAGLDVGKIWGDVESGAMSADEALALLAETQAKQDGVTDGATRRAAGWVAMAQQMADTTTSELNPAIEGATNRAAGWQAAADLAEQATRDLADAYKELKGELDQKQAWLNLEDKLRTFRWNIAAGKMSIDEKRAALVDIQQELLNYLATIDGVPAEKQTEILALIRQGDIDEAEAQLAHLTRTRSVTVNVNGITPGGKYVPGGSNIVIKDPIANAEGAGATGAVVNRPTVALIGEAGPEALIPLDRTRGNSPLPELGAGTGGDVHYHLTVDARGAVGLTGPQIEQWVHEMWTAARRKRGKST